MRTLIVGSIYGSLIGLIDLMKQMKYDTKDRLIFLGNYVGCFPQSYEVCAYIRSLKVHNENVICLEGEEEKQLKLFLNKFAMNLDTPSGFMRLHAPKWWDSFGEQIITSFANVSNAIIAQTYHEFLAKLLPFYCDQSNNLLFVPKGFNIKKGFAYTVFNEPNLFLEDTSLYDKARKLEFLKSKKGAFLPNTETLKIGGFDRIFINGLDTSLEKGKYKSLVPVIKANVVNLNQGHGHNGYMTAYIHETNEYFIVSDSSKKYASLKKYKEAIIKEQP